MRTESLKQRQQKYKIRQVIKSISNDAYERYFYNSIDDLKYVRTSLRKNSPIDDTKIGCIIDIKEFTNHQLISLISKNYKYFENLKIINDDTIKNFTINNKIKKPTKYKIKDKQKLKLKKFGMRTYIKYFFNTTENLKDILTNIELNIPIDESNLDVIFEIDNIEICYELITYFPNTIKQQKYITNEWVDTHYGKFGETIHLLKNHKKLIRSNLKQNAKSREINCDIDVEKNLLPKYCKYLNIELEYESISTNNKTASIDKLDPTKPYSNDNIQIISFLANRMKNSADIEQLKTFAKNVLSIHS